MIWEGVTAPQKFRNRQNSVQPERFFRNETRTRQYSKCASMLVSKRNLPVYFNSSVTLDVVYKCALDTRSNLCGTRSHKMVIETTLDVDNWI